jgi:hypothetical protein
VHDDDLSIPLAWPAPSGPALSPPRSEPDATTSSRLRRAAAGVGFLAVAGIGGITAYGVIHDEPAGSSQRGTSVTNAERDDSDGRRAVDEDHDAGRPDDGDHRGSSGQAPSNGGAPQPGRPGPGSQSTSSSS